MENMAASPPIYILHASCVVFPEYVKRKHVFKYAIFSKICIIFLFRLNATDGAEYLFACDNNTKMIEWVDKVNFHARLDPSNQLVSYKEVKVEYRHENLNLNFQTVGDYPSHMPPPRPDEQIRSRTLDLHPTSSTSSYDGPDSRKSMKILKNVS